MIRIGSQPQQPIKFPRIKTSFSEQHSREIVENPEDRSLKGAITELVETNKISQEQANEMQTWEQLAEIIEKNQISRQQHDQMQQTIFDERVENAVATGIIFEEQAKGIKTLDEYYAALSQRRYTKRIKE